MQDKKCITSDKYFPNNIFGGDWQSDPGQPLPKTLEDIKAVLLLYSKPEFPNLQATLQPPACSRPQRRPMPISMSYIKKYLIL